MELGKYWKKVKPLLLLLMIAVPWFFRDKFAVELDKQSDLVQKALTETYSEARSMSQDEDQREVLDRLKKLELANPKTANDVDAVSEYYAAVTSDGEELQRAAATLQNLVEELEKAGFDNKQLKEAVGTGKGNITRAQKASQTLIDWAKAGQEGKLEEGQDLDYKEYNAAAKALNQSFEAITGAAEKERDESASTAGSARNIAWFTTALAALMAGDWKGLLKQFTGGGDSDSSESQSS